MRFDSISQLNAADERWYSPTLQRWVTMDPTGFGGGDVNLYRFVGNEPTDETDPSGLQPPKDPSYKPHPPSRKQIEDWTNPNVIVTQITLENTLVIGKQFSGNCLNYVLGLPSGSQDTPIPGKNKAKKG
jgi:RHS repeat-associated protein